MIKCESSNLSEFGWKDGTLTVVFKSRAVYDYFKVPEKVFVEMQAAERKGKFLNAFVKSVYNYKKVNN